MAHFNKQTLPVLLLPPDTLFVNVLDSEEASDDAPDSRLASFSFETKPSPVNLLVKGEALSPILRALIGEYFSKLSLERDRGAGFINPLSSGEFRLGLGVLRPSLKFGEAKSWFGLPSAWNELLQSSDVGVTEPGRKKVSKPSPISRGMFSDISPGFNSGRVGARVFARRGRPKIIHNIKSRKNYIACYYLWLDVVIDVLCWGVLLQNPLPRNCEDLMAWD